MNKFKPGDKVKILKLWPCESGLQEEEFGIFTVRKVKNNLVKIKTGFLRWEWIPIDCLFWFIEKIRWEFYSKLMNIKEIKADILFDYIDDLMVKRDYDRLEEILGEKCNIEDGIVLLSATLPVKSQLVNRPGLYDRLALMLTENGENPEEALIGLK